MKQIPHDQLIKNRIYYFHDFGDMKFRFIKKTKNSILFKPINNELYDYEIDDNGYVSFPINTAYFWIKDKN